MTLWTVLPVKSCDKAKSRMAPDLSPQARAELAMHLFLQTLGTALEFAQGEPVLVVTQSQAIATIARRRGAQVLEESEAGGLNAALCQAFERVRRGGGTRILAVATDLPLLTVADLEAMTASTATEFAIAPDRHRRGTNALAQPITSRPLFSFGVDSLARHLSAIEARGTPARLVSTTGLQLDLDCAADLAVLAAYREGGSPDPALRSLLVSIRGLAPVIRNIGR